MVHLKIAMTSRRLQSDALTCEFFEPFIEHQGERRGFWLRRPRPVGRKILIAADGSSVPDRHRGRTVVVLDVRTAFGTGGHGTTEGCLVALEKFIAGGEAVLDVGTGTGILAIAARKLGAARVTAVDIAAAACAEAVKNVALNGIAGGIDVVRGGIDSAKGRFDMIVANLRTPVLVDLMGEVAGRLDDRGIAIFSGILEREFHPFLSSLEGHPLETVEVGRVHGWMTVVSRRRERAPGL